MRHYDELLPTQREQVDITIKSLMYGILPEIYDLNLDKHKLLEEHLSYLVLICIEENEKEGSSHVRQEKPNARKNRGGRQF